MDESTAATILRPVRKGRKARKRQRYSYRVGWRRVRQVWLNQLWEERFVYILQLEWKLPKFSPCRCRSIENLSRSFWNERRGGSGMKVGNCGRPMQTVVMQVYHCGENQWLCQRVRLEGATLWKGFVWLDLVTASTKSLQVYNSCT